MYICDTVELKKEMVEKGIRTNLELSRRSGVNRNTVGQVVEGKKQPSTDVMHRLAYALELTSERAGIIFFKPNLRKRKK